MIQHQRSKNISANPFYHAAGKEQPDGTRDVVDLDILLSEAYSLGCGVNDSGRLAGASSLRRTKQPHLSSRAPAGVLFLPGHADVAVTYKQPICDWHERYASERKSM